MYVIPLKQSQENSTVLSERNICGGKIIEDVWFLWSNKTGSKKEGVTLAAANEKSLCRL